MHKTEVNATTCYSYHFSIVNSQITQLPAVKSGGFKTVLFCTLLWRACFIDTDTVEVSSPYFNLWKLHIYSIRAGRCAHGPGVRGWWPPPLGRGAQPLGEPLMLIFGSCNRFWITVILIHSLYISLYYIAVVWWVVHTRRVEICWV